MILSITLFVMLVFVNGHSLVSVLEVCCPGVHAWICNLSSASSHWLFFFLPFDLRRINSAWLLLSEENPVVGWARSCRGGRVGTERARDKDRGRDRQRANKEREKESQKVAF